MANITQQLLEEILEVSGDWKKVEHDISDAEFNKLRVDLSERIFSHYKKNLKQQVDNCRKAPGQKAYYYGGTSPVAIAVEKRLPLDMFIRKAALYYDKLVIGDPLFLVLERAESDKTWKVRSIRRQVSRDLRVFSALKPWVEQNLVELVVPPFAWSPHMNEALTQLVREDSENQEWRKATLSHTHKGLQGAQYIEYMKNYARQELLEERIRKPIKDYALGLIYKGSSVLIGNAIVGGGVLDCAPATDLPHLWKLLGVWLCRREELLLKEKLIDPDLWDSLKATMKAGQAFLTLKDELGFVRNLPPEQILDLRNTPEYRFRDFRELWTELCREIKKMSDYDSVEEFEKDTKQLWNEKVEPEVQRIKNEITKIKVKFAGAAVSAMSLFTAFIPGLQWVSVASGILTFIFGKESLLDFRKKLGEIKSDERNAAYFLLEARGKSGNKEIITGVSG